MTTSALKAQIIEDMKSAMRAKEKERLSTIRMLLAALKQKEVDDRVELTDADVLTIINKQVKQRRDAIEQYLKGERQDLADKEQAEIEVLQAYLPAQLSEAEIQTAVADAVSTTGAASMKDMGKVMGILKPKLTGQADMGLVSKLVKAALNS